ncbi:MAG: response regulator transcription factor [Oscillospiraceae bacterium]|nr:response regulator transcription factor [Oscillospiraceae bacterium]
MTMKILIIDDEELLVKGISYNLENEGYQVVTGTNGLEAIRLAQDPEVKLIVLDVMMPVMDGLEACRRIRQFSDVPIIMLTAKTEDMDKLLGFDCGADDYLTKPFNILELKARIRAILKRSNKQQQSESRIVRGSITLDSQSRSTLKNGVPVELTAKEFDLVELLIQNPNRVYSRENLLDIIWGDDYRSDIRTVDVHIRRIREKLERDPANPAHILTKWGVGYYFKA